MTVTDKPARGSKGLASARGKRRQPAAHPRVLLEANLLGLSVGFEAELLNEVEHGFSFGQWERLQESAKLNRSQLADLVQMTTKTVERRKKAGRLEADESDRLLRISRVLARAIELFEGDRDGALHWLESPAIAFGGRTPLSLARTDIGAREVERLIGQLEQGVFP